MSPLLKWLFTSRLPRHGFGSDDLDRYGLRLYDSARLIQKSFVQYNAKHSIAWLVYDLDSDTASTDYLDRPWPTPNIVALNPTTGHAHYFYAIRTPVHRYYGASERALRLAAAIDVGMIELLGSDCGFAEFISKNPLSDRWRTWTPREEPYELDELKDWIRYDKYRDRRRRLPAIGLGRNSTLFERLRIWAYRARREPNLSEELFFSNVLKQALIINSGFNPPLPNSEVRSTAKSVARWVWRRMSPEGFRARQKLLAAKGHASQTAASQVLGERIRQTARECPSLSQEDIAVLCGVCRATVNRHLRGTVTLALSDKGLPGPDLACSKGTTSDVGVHKTKCRTRRATKSAPRRRTVA